MPCYKKIWVESLTKLSKLRYILFQKYSDDTGISRLICWKEKQSSEGLKKIYLQPSASLNWGSRACKFRKIPYKSILKSAFGQL